MKIGEVSGPVAISSGPGVMGGLERGQIQSAIVRKGVVGCLRPSESQRDHYGTQHDPFKRSQVRSLGSALSHLSGYI